MNRRGHTMIELIVTLSILVTIVGATILLFSFVVIRGAYMLSRHTALMNVERPMNEITKTVRLAKRCDVVSIGGRDFLKVTLPQAGIDKDVDGLIDTATPAGPNKAGRMFHLPGKRVYYYTSDATGDPGTNGRFVFRAVRNDETSPLLANIDNQWSFEPGTTQPRYQLNGTMNLSIDQTLKTLTVTFVTPSPLKDGSESLRPPFPTFSRTIMWRNSY